MTGTETTQALPVWIWLTFVILVSGVIALIYSRGNWRSTIGLMVIALFGVFFATESDYVINYFSTHFIGGYDQLGVPFQQARPGWSLLFTAWPLWIIPALLAVAITATICNILFKPSTKTVISEQETDLLPQDNVNKQLEVARLKQSLASVMQSVETQANMNRELELKLLQTKKNNETTIAELNDQITALEVDLLRLKKSK